MLNTITATMNAPKNAGWTMLRIGLQHQHQAGDDDDQLAGFGLQHRDERPRGSCGPAVAERKPEDHRERDSRHEAYGTAQERRPGAAPSPPRRRR